MSLSINTPGVTFDRFVKAVTPPIRNGLTSAFHLGDDADASAVNLGSGADATVGSSVTFQPAYMEARGGNTNALFAIQTTDQDDASDDLTFCALVRRNDTAFRQIIGTYNAGTNGAGLTTNGLSIGSGSGVVTSPYTYSPTGVWIFHAGLIYDDTLLAVTGYDGRLLLSDPVVGERVQSTNGARIGGALATSSTASVDIAIVSKHMAALSQKDLLEVYLYMRARGSDIGLAVV